MSDEVLIEKSDHITTITLNRPDRLNAISGPMLRELSRQLIQADAERDTRVIVLTGAGRGFCAGLDLQAVGSGGIGSNTGEAPAPSRLDDSPPFVLRRLDTPVLCGLNGPAAGYGMAMALGCDLVVASDTASLSPPIQRGVVPESGGTWLLPRLVGWQKACEIAMLGRKLRADDLERLGLVNLVVPADDFADTLRSWATELAKQAPLAMKATKRTMRLGLDTAFDANAHHVMAEFYGLTRSKDFSEGVNAFLEKREPQYTGH
jgi:enoyl-CoA hydratase/carnithine racemase